MTEDEQQACQIARDILARRIGVLEGSRALLPLLRSNEELAPEADRHFVTAIESETDHLPLGLVRELWDPDVLPEKDREIEQCEQLWRNGMHGVCERILLRALWREGRQEQAGSVSAEDAFERLERKYQAMLVDRRRP